MPKAKTPFALPPEANLVILPPQRGSGNASFGTFTAAGDVYIELECNGPGTLTIPAVSRSNCPGGLTGITVPGARGTRYNLAVRANPKTTWQIAVGEHIAGATLVLVHRSGSGNASFGPFRVSGPITVAGSCTGHGNFAYSVVSTKPAKSDGVGTTCPFPGGSFGPDSAPKPGSPVRIRIDAGPRAHWTVTVTQQPNAQP